MGVIGRSIVSGEYEISKKLLTAYCDEWFAHYNYRFTALVIRGHRAPALAELLERKSAQAFERARRLGKRLLELGQNPPEKMGDLKKFATDKPFKLPKTLEDMDAILRAVLDAERTSIRGYHGLHESCRRDPITRELALNYLMAAVAGEQELELLLGDTAPRMRGT